jgi:hypothetical protein
LITDVDKIDNNYLKVFPNPSIGIFSVDLKNNKIDTKICVYDVYGNCFYTKNLRNNASTQIDLRSQPKGIYFMEIVADGEKTVKKIVLQ